MRTTMDTVSLPQPFQLPYIWNIQEAIRQNSRIIYDNSSLENCVVFQERHSYFRICY